MLLKSKTGGPAGEFDLFHAKIAETRGPLNKIEVLWLIAIICRHQRCPVFASVCLLSAPAITQVYVYEYREEEINYR